MSRRIWLVIFACCILTAAAIAHGRRTDRWEEAVDLKAAALQLDQLPLQLGDWDGKPIEVPAAQVAAASAAGITSRRYSNRYTGAEVNVMVICGRPGPVAVHPPDICYAGAGYAPGPKQIQPIGENDSAWVADFKRGGPQPATLRIRWAWSNGGNWKASTSPRMDFARSKALLKIYVVRSIPQSGDATSPELELIKELVPALATVLPPR